MPRTVMRSSLLAGVVALALLALGAGPAGAGGAASPAAMANSYTVTPLVSDQSGEAPVTDPDLVNAWGLAAGPTSPWWVANNGTNTSTLYEGGGTKLGLVVRVGGAPTGTVFNGGSNFVVSDGTHMGPSVFLFATESGLIRGWNPGVPPPPPSTKAFTVANRQHVDAEYKGLAIASTSSGDRLYATDFHNGRVDVFDGNFNLLQTKGDFVDPDISGKYAPFGIQNLGGNIFVTYAKVGSSGDDVSGHGHGFVDEYDTSGNLIARVGTHGALNSPWGLAMARSDFGQFSGDLLVGNFGNGKINAFSWSGGAWQRDGKLKMANGHVLKIDGLWALGFGNGRASGATNSLYFTAGPDDESHGLFGKVTADS
jgi:uncharacterized protein (TIGR03118 family)